jgi:hypothetical protein
MRNREIRDNRTGIKVIGILRGRENADGIIGRNNKTMDKRGSDNREKGHVDGQIVVGRIVVGQIVVGQIVVGRIVVGRTTYSPSHLLITVIAQPHSCHTE